jgi:hypothetical protein
VDLDERTGGRGAFTARRPHGRTSLLGATFLFALAAAATPALAQAREPILPTLPGSTRAAAMGDAFGISQTDSDAVFYNAAFDDRLRGAGASFGRYGAGSTVYAISAGTDWWGGAIGLGAQALDYGLPARAGRDAGPGDLFGRGARAVSERALSLAYGRRVKGVRLALTARHFEQRAAGARNALLLADVATAFGYRFLSVGLAAQNLGPSDYGGGAAVDVPLRGRLDLATRSHPLGPLDVAGAAALSYVRGGDLAPAAGVELAYWPVPGRTFFARGGVRRPLERRRPFTLGGGFAGDKIILDYALEPFEQGRLAHRFGVRWR